MATDTPPLALRTDAEGRTCVDLPPSYRHFPRTYWLEPDGDVTRSFTDHTDTPRRYTAIAADEARAIAMLVNAREGTESAHDLRVMLDGALRAHVELARQRDNLREKLLAAERYVAILRSDLADATRDLAARQQRDAEAAPANREESEPAG